MTTTILLMIFELINVVLGFCVYAAMSEFDECVSAAILDKMTPFRRDKLVAAQRSHEIARNAMVAWSIISMFALFFTLLANL